MNFRRLEEFMVRRGGSVDPSKFKDEVFELLSIPAFDQGFPEIVEGSKIGSAKKSVEPGDVLLSKIVPHIRRCWIVPNSNNKRQIASGEWIQFRGKDFNSGFLRLFLISNHFHSQFIKTVKGVGGSLLRASPEQVADIEIPLPPLDDQIRIAHLLGKVEGLIAQRKKHIQQLDDLVKSVFLEMFGDPVKNEKGWERVPLEKFGSVNRGVSKHRPRNDPKLLGGKYPLIQTSEVANSGSYIRSYSQSYSEFGYAQSKEWPTGTLCITIAANIARTSILGFDACFPDSVVGFIPFKGESNALYVHGLFWFFQSILEKNAPSAAQKNINLEILRNLEMPKPPIKLQDSFASFFTRVINIKSHFEQSLSDLEALYGKLSQQAFKGELDLSRIPLPSEALADKPTVTPPPQPVSVAQTLKLPHTPLLSQVLESRDQLQSLFHFWLGAYRNQLVDAPFSVGKFLDAARTRLAEAYPDQDFNWGSKDYEILKAWVFDSLASGTLIQDLDQTQNRIQLKAART